MGDEQSFLSSYKQDLGRVKTLGQIVPVLSIGTVFLICFVAYFASVQIIKLSWELYLVIGYIGVSTILLFVRRQKLFAGIKSPGRLDEMVNKVKSGEWSPEAGEAAMSLRRKYDDRYAKTSDAENEMLAKLSEAVRSARMKSV